jgi:RNA polymerase sigma-70 factor (ECF subfamily)
LATAVSEEILQKRSAIAKLYETHFDRVVRYILIRIGDAAEAEDLASEVFVKALRAADAYKETGAPMEAWLFRIAHNIVVDHLRRKSRRPAAVPIDEAFSLSGTDNPAEQVERRQALSEMRAALAGLSDAQQRVIALRFGAELSAEEVAGVLGKRAGAIREMQSAAVKKLRSLLKEQRSSST